jgi:cytochrome P450
MPYVDLSLGQSFARGFPHEFFTWLRRDAPVWWHEPTDHTPDGEGFWVVSRYADVVAVFKDAATFSSELGGTQIARGGRLGDMLNVTDDPKHRRLRALVNMGFKPRMIARLEDDLRDRTRRILDAVPEGAPFEFMHVVARELPSQAICGVLGVPEEDRPALVDLVDRAIATGPDTGHVMGLEESRQLGRYGDALVEAKRRQPADDILSAVVHARLDDGSPQLTTMELRGFFQLLFAAGSETTRSAIGGGLLALIENPDELDRLRGDPAPIATAVEEFVRWTSPSVYKRRTATRDVEFHGQLIRAGAKVTVWEASANRDEAEFPDPFRFDVGRNPNDHVGFGLGTHFCLGASLARLELTVMFQELLDRFERFELVGEPHWAPNNRLVGLTHLPIRATRKRSASTGALRGAAGRSRLAGNDRPERTEPELEDEHA